MATFHVVCQRVTLQRVVLEVRAKSAADARRKVEDSDGTVFREEGVDEGTSEVTVESVLPAKVSR